MKKYIGIMLAALALTLVLSLPAKGQAATLTQGMSGGSVKDLQEHLMAKGVFPYPEATSYFGSITTQATKQFQKESNLTVDGIAGTKTNSKVNTLRKGDIGKPVAKLQRLLRASGVSNSTVDGIYGNGTKQAVIAFQKQKGLTADGIAGSATFGKLNQKVSLASSPVKTVTVTSTAYTADCTGCSGITRMGINLKKYPNGKVIAVDPNVIPLGSTVQVDGYGKATAVDTGGAIKGNRIDVFISKESDALKWGRKQVTVKVLD